MSAVEETENRIIQLLLAQIDELKAENAAIAAGGKRVLMVLTSNSKLGNTGESTGWYLPECAHPYFVFRDAGCAITIASIAGGAAPVDHSSIDMSDAEQKVEQSTAEVPFANTISIIGFLGRSRHQRLDTGRGKNTSHVFGSPLPS
jgi:putative intracellular protease/amidase